MNQKSSSTRPVRPGPYPELTIPALVVGYLLGIVIAVSIGYASLILGFSIEGSELAAILGFAILRGILGRNSIVENNINQTVASAVNGASSGMMFSVPALFILGETGFNPYFMVLGCIVGAILGIAFIIPLRKQMIDFNRLAYPGGIAVAAVLKSPGAGMRKAMLMLGAALLSGIVHTFVQIYDYHDVPVAEWLPFIPEYTNLIFYASLLTIGVGFLSGKGGVFFVIGGYACYWVLAPILSAMGKIPGVDGLGGNPVPEYLRLTLFRPLGIGMLIGGALAGIVLALPLIVSAIGSMRAAAKSRSDLAKDEMPIKLLGMAVGGAVVLLLIIAIQSTAHMGVLRGVAMALLGTAWIWVSGVILSECIGRTNWSPLSGMTLIGITLLVFVASGLGDAEAIIASVMVGAAMCVAMSQATDLMMDLKTGYLVGATPRKQQLGQFAGAWLGPIVIMVLIYVLHADAGLGSDKLPAPQGQALASMIKSLLGDGGPTHQYLAGAGLGAVLSASGIGGLGILVGLGFYLPFNIVLTYTIGTALRLLADRYRGKAWSEEVGVPLAAGLLVGEALVGVGAAVSKVVFGA
ncbi:OPT family oligopeptide transporter [Haliangium sp.]|uniref:OPT family oligopeptide transporter n=1 Tax=Haliangium sp. TaxID=2663208 RepID=UPI003D0F0DFF